MGSFLVTGTNGGFPTKNLVLLTEYAIVLWKKWKTTIMIIIIVSNNMRKASKAEISHGVYQTMWKNSLVVLTK